MLIAPGRTRWQERFVRHFSFPTDWAICFSFKQPLDPLGRRYEAMQAIAADAIAADVIAADVIHLS